MPTYVYACSACNNQFEVEQRITADPLDECTCGSKGTVKRVIQPVGVIFNGAGFHINDYSAKPAAAKEEVKAEPAKVDAPAPAAPAAPDANAPAPAPAKSDT